MKKRSWMVVAMVLTLTVLAAGSAMAKWDGADGRGGQRGYNCWAAEGAEDVDLEKVAKFQKETLPLRDELMMKKLELRQEYAKEKPDADVIGKLRKEMIDIQTSIDKVAADLGLEGFGPNRGFGCGSGRANGDCPRGRF